jgi:hypothetical protein
MCLFTRTTVFACLAVVLCLSAACRTNNEVNPANPNSQTIVVSDSSETTGSLQVRIVNVSGLPLNNADVSLYATYQDYLNNVFLFKLVTNSNGFVHFGFVNFGNYYLRAEFVSGSFLTNAPGTIVQVQARKHTDAVITLR